MRIPQSTIDEIKTQSDILDIVSEYVKLEKRGRNYIGLCPFHDEKTPSFTVSEDKQICHCFGCKKGGNVFQFIQEIENVSFTDAVKKLGARVNIKVDTGESKELEHIASDDLTMIQMHESLLDYYHYLLKKTVEGEKALKYLYDRGFTDEIIDERKIGFAPNSSHFATNFMEKKGYDLQLAYEAGILSRNETEFNYYDRFRDRIIFPLANAQGRIVGYSGRTYTGQEPKYLNSPESPIFQKRKMLYNLDKARKSIRQNDEVILLEGFMDVIKSDSAGLKNVVASMGTQLSNEHITFLKKLCGHITIMYDGDNAGINAALKTGQTLLQQQFNVYVVQLPTKMDPDEYICKFGAEKFRDFVNKEKKSFVSFKLHLNQSEIQNNDLSYEKYYKTFIEDAAHINSKILRNKVIQDAAQVFKISAESLNKEVERINPQQNVAPRQVQHETPQYTTLTKYEKAERALLKHFISDKEVFLSFYQDIEETDFTNQHFKRIFSILREFYSNNDSFVMSDFITYVNQEELKEVLIHLVDYPLNHEPFENEITDYIKLMTEHRFSESIETLHEKLREATRIGDTESQKYYLEMIVNKNRARLKSQE
ncbi:DNA primase [Staphylococcus schleiferi]|uniref:DNA primase n=1 Tax=Staphylococcus sp. 191 TaxID=2070016 RepID=UPI0013F4A6AF|nr:DNA primase [Staphylococcus sp. 191]NHA36044.1 DNA primase [Staphylococcus schleiferi]NHB71372.1 DNA primase [Staphylococcus sp. 191]